MSLEQPKEVGFVGLTEQSDGSGSFDGEDGEVLSCVDGGLQDRGNFLALGDDDQVVRC